MGLMSPRSVSASRKGDPCTLKGNLAGICQGSSKCVPRINKYIETKRLTPSDIPSCGLSTREEIVCCPVAECCGDDQRPSSSSVNDLPTRKPDNAEHAWHNVDSRGSVESTTGRSTPKTDNSNLWKLKLDPDSPYFDFSQMMSGSQLPNTVPGDRADNTINENVAGGGSHISIAHNAAESQPFPTRDPRPIQSASPPHVFEPVHYPTREPRIINRPFPHEHPRRIMPWTSPSQQPIEWPGSNSNTATNQQPIWQPLPEYPAPYKETQMPQSNSNNEWNWQESTSRSPLPPAPSPRTDVPRPAVQACRAIETRQLEYGLTEHILDGIAVDPGYYPHMAAIAFSEFDNIVFGCGGSLISTRHVLTAAHCVNDPNKIPLFARLGTVNIDNVSEHRQDINITTNINIHPEYVSTSKYNDIAILELAEEVRLTNHTYPACLETELFDPPSNASIFVAGWGIMNTTTRRTSKILLRAPLTVVPLAQCNESFAAQPLSQRYLDKGIINTLLCAADLIKGTKDACQGDSGGPLVLERDKENNKYSVMGVISSGFGCATITPGLYTRVASYLDYIEGIVWPNGFV
ncbi:hypothetical protein AWZ03_012306 [Drosophila navojoa]|uniref:Peptidase S1 domain-containing protein n=1 Tax=Drosophila navojoa TaxID=7232 RepID=A0A484AXR1_DRONA|nr:hypothetical protein AWZ03_012306 [Drosophila navojoa]